MKKFAFLLVVFTVMTLTSATCFSQETVMVRVVESWKPADWGFLPAHIIISYSNREMDQEVIELENNGKKHIMENTAKINEVLNRFHVEGYEIVSTTSNTYDVINNYIWVFRKEE